MAAGWSSRRDLHSSFLTCSFIQLLFMLVGFKMDRISFGNPDLTLKSFCTELLAYGSYVAVVLGMLFNIYSFPTNMHSLVIVVGMSGCLAGLSNGARTGCLLVLWCLCAYVLLHGVTDSAIIKRYKDVHNDGDEFSGFWEPLHMITASVLPRLPFAIYTRYSKDHNIVLLQMFLHFFSKILSFFSAAGRHRRVLIYGIINALFIYATLLYMRNRRHLPPSLDGAKFISLAYLRKLAARGQRICRCQDLPPQAFGDVTKALHLIVVSHRWLDPFTCDCVTDEYPVGLRLTTMLKKLNLHFSFRCGCDLRESWKRLQAGVVGGQDIVLFFDFMCIPQETKDADGMVVARTPEEERVFWNCLPSMGSLYSQFPVMVNEEISEDGLSYHQSGWCFSELTIATTTTTATTTSTTTTTT